MRVEFNSLDEFISEVESDGVYRDIVRVRVDRVPEQQSASTFSRVMWLTAIQVDSSHHEFLLECIHDLGRERNGVAEQNEREARERLAKLDGISIRHGKLDFR